jgi:AraC-like DNA-binding protein
MDALRELKRLMARQLPAGGGRWRNDALGVMLASAERDQHATKQVYEPVFALVVQGEKKLVLGNRVFTCGEGTFAVVSVDLPITFHVSRATPREPYMALALSLKPAAVATLLLEAAGTASTDHTPADAEVGMGVSHASDELLEAVVRLVRLLERPRDLPVLGPIAEKEILWRLLCSEQAHRLRQIGLGDGRAAQIGRAMRFMREHYDQALSIEALARLSAMSVTSFHRHFRAVALMSPLQYLKQIRLQEARARLLVHADDVASVGHSVGYDSPSQFSREYKRAYGSPPGQDARLLRAASKR